MKLEKLEKQEHQWISQARTIIIKLDKIRPQMQRVLAAAVEKTQILGTNMINILSIDMHQNIEKLLTLATLTIEIHKALRT